MRTPRSIETIQLEIDAVSDALDAQAACSEKLGTASPELVGIMRSLRVPMIKAPVEVGGDHLHLADQLAFFERLSYWNPTAAWTGFNHAGAAGIAGAMLGQEGIDTLFADDASPFLAAVSAPSGTFRVVPGGITLSGRWKYASGVPHSEWILLTALGDGAPGLKIGIVNRSQFELAGEWNVIALQGTGSIDVVVESAFVPDHLTFSPGSPIRRGGTMYALGYQGYVAPENLGFTLGVCQRFVDEIVTYSQGKARGLDGRLADRGAFKYELGKAQLQIDAARGYARDEFRAVDDLIRRGETPQSSDTVRLGGVIAYATDMAVGAVTNLFHFAGAGALFASGTLQRCFRDAVGSHQHLMASNIAYDRRGELMLAGSH
jgi:alkylation response protein AidB-like acyl-CoA dehydrogenase